MNDQYIPLPIDTRHVTLPAEILEAAELLAKNTHENWSALRLAEGWQWGPIRDDARKLHPCLLPYEELPESEKEYDRRTAMETLKTILALGFEISKRTD